ncbi:MAG: hypothetical protein IGS03_00705 [Candidatus Sericytochromatia bacterium]|nr:hypothetical protein [Candidatus Sericytochromatia bacterium]
MTLTDQGFMPQTAREIEQELIGSITSIPGFENIPTDGSSAWGNLISILAEREALVQGLALAIWQSAYRATATGFSLDMAMVNLGKSRNLARHSTVTLTLFNRSSDSPVTVPSESQARQSSTGVLWETLEDAEIPALDTLLAGLDIDTIAWQSGNTIRATFNGTPDLSAVAQGDLLLISNAAESGNNGTFVITAINTGAYWVEYTNPDRTDNTDDEATDSPATADIEDTETSITVPAQSLSTGPFEATPGSINAIATPISGWSGVSNAGSALIGRNQESDSEFALRVAQELVVAQGSTAEAIKAQLYKLADVRYVSAKENRTATVDSDGNAPHSYRFTIVGGTTQDIVDTIGRYGAGGIQTNGTVSGTYTAPEGRTETIYFDRVDEINPYIVVNLTINSAYPSDGDALISAALENVAFEAGDDLYNYRLIQAAANASVPGIEAIEIFQGTSPAPATKATIVVAPDEIINITEDRITVNS